MPGRGAYGVKRAAVDAAKAEGISREGLKAHGGWTDTQMPDQVYADQELEAARREAAAVRARIRGENIEPALGRTQNVPANEEPATEGYAGSGGASE